MVTVVVLLMLLPVLVVLVMVVLLVPVAVERLSKRYYDTGMLSSSPLFLMLVMLGVMLVGSSKDQSLLLNV